MNKLDYDISVVKDFYDSSSGTLYMSGIVSFFNAAREELPYSFVLATTCDKYSADTSYDSAERYPENPSSTGASVYYNPTDTWISEVKVHPTKIKFLDKYHYFANLSGSELEDMEYVEREDASVAIEEGLKLLSITEAEFNMLLSKLKEESKARFASLAEECLEDILKNEDDDYYYEDWRDVE